MGEKSAIEWTDASWTPIRARNRATGKIGHHCEHVTTGCEFCYAETMNKRFGTGLPFKPGHRKDIEIFLDEKMLLAPLRWKKPRMIFVCSMTDLFADFVPDTTILRVLDIIRSTSFDGGSNCGKIAGEHTYQILTKRAARMASFMTRLRFNHLAALNECALYLADDGKHPTVLKNLWLGVSCERQQEANERIPNLLATPAAVRFISAEPLLGPVNIADAMMTPAGLSVLLKKQVAGQLTGGRGSIHWVIVGGESGPHARSMHPDWARSLRDQCAAAGVAFFFKQWGQWSPSIDRDRDDPDWRMNYGDVKRWPQLYRILNLEGGQGFHGERVHLMTRMRKADAGRLLDGREWNEFPTIGAREAAA